jgi:hypothetical protein
MLLSLCGPLGPIGELGFELIPTPRNLLVEKRADVGRGSQVTKLYIFRE